MRLVLAGFASLLCAVASAQSPAPTGTPAAVATISLGELFEPIGPRGLVFSPKARAIDRLPVAITGYVVREKNPPSGRVLLAPLPLQLHEDDDGQADDLPAATVRVQLRTGMAPGALVFNSRTTFAGVLSLEAVEDAPGGRRFPVQLQDAVPVSPEPPPAAGDGRPDQRSPIP